MGVNVKAQHLMTANNLGYVVLDVDRGHGTELKQKLMEVRNTVFARSLLRSSGTWANNDYASDFEGSELSDQA